MIDDPGPMPTPKADEPELYPGGVDAIEGTVRYGEITDGPMGADMPAAKHPSAAETPHEVAQPDDKQQAPDDGAGESGERDAEDAEVEPPV